MMRIYNYTDYRCFLKDSIAALRAKNARFSYRSFNRVAGLRSSGFLKLVIDGKRNLADDGMKKVAKGLKLKADEGHYFEQLVKFNQAKTLSERDAHLSEMMRSKAVLKATPLAHGQYQLFSHWYYVAILELCRLDPATPKTTDWMTSRLHPAVPRQAVSDALATLVKLGLLSQNDDGQFARTDAMLTTDDEVASVLVTRFHTQMSQMAIRAVKEDAAEDREFSALTVAVSPRGLKLAKQEIQAFRKRLHSLLEQDGGGPQDTVVHMNLQLFKLSRG